MNTELGKVVENLKAAQGRLQNLVKNKGWIDEARKYAEKQGKEVKKLLSADVGKVRTFLERERKELERFQKSLPGEVNKLRKLVVSQRKEFESLLKKVKKATKKGGKVSKKAAPHKKVAKVTKKGKSSAGASASAAN